jgi:hypothetical protein
MVRFESFDGFVETAGEVARPGGRRLDGKRQRIELLGAPHFGERLVEAAHRR